MVCAYCREPLELDGPMGWVHQTGSMFGPDGHAACPVTPEAAETSPPPWR